MISPLLFLGIATLAFEGIAATPVNVEATEDGLSPAARRLASTEMIKPDLSNSSWCGPNRHDIELFLLGVNINASGFFAGMQRIISEQLGIHHACVDIKSVTPMGGQGRRLADGARLIAEAALPAGVTNQLVLQAILDVAPKDYVCKEFRVAANVPCNITGADMATTTQALRGAATIAIASTSTTTLRTTTTTTEMPWGMPWWAWFLTCVGVLLGAALALGALSILGVAASSGGAARSDSRVIKEPTSPRSEATTMYEVVDEPDAPMSGTFVNENGVPMASVTIPWASVTVPAEAVRPLVAHGATPGQSFVSAAGPASYAAPMTTRY